MARRRDIPRDDILDAAQHLLQARGSRGFGLRELATEIGLRTASLQYHFPTKADLLAAIVRRYRDRLNARLAAIEAETEEFAGRLERMAAHFLVLTENGASLCLLGATAAEAPALPPGPAEECRQLAANLLGWLTRFATRARAAGDLPAGSDPESIAIHFLATLQGAFVLARSTSTETAARAIRESVIRCTPTEKHA